MLVVALLVESGVAARDRIGQESGYLASYHGQSEWGVQEAFAVERHSGG